MVDRATWKPLQTATNSIRLKERRPAVIRQAMTSTAEKRERKLEKWGRCQRGQIITKVALPLEIEAFVVIIPH